MDRLQTDLKRWEKVKSITKQSVWERAATPLSRPLTAAASRSLICSTCCGLSCVTRTLPPLQEPAAALHSPAASSCLLQDSLDKENQTGSYISESSSLICPVWSTKARLYCLSMIKQNIQKITQIESNRSVCQEVVWSPSGHLVSGLTEENQRHSKVLSSDFFSLGFCD